MNDKPQQSRERWIYSRFFTTRTGKRIYHPNGGVFRFKVKDR